MNNTRVRLLKEGKKSKIPVVYWMSRDQRVRDNWALLFAQDMAMKQQAPLAVIFCLVPQFLNATVRHYDFMLTGLETIEEGLSEKHIPFYLLTGAPDKEIPRFLQIHRVGTLVTDFDPLRIKRIWKEHIAKKIDTSFYEVDSRNIVPCWIASPKQEFGAYTFRPKIHRWLKDYLVEFPPLQKNTIPWVADQEGIGWSSVKKALDVDSSVGAVNWIKPGERAAHKVLSDFIETHLSRYPTERNNPNNDSQSNLSPYLHFGQISSQRVAFEVIKRVRKKEHIETFLEELIVRRELSDNYCFYNIHYDMLQGFPPWAQKTLNDHRKDYRPYRYSLSEFEEAKTHDDLWNAAQMEMVKRGKMHGYLRMYWAKKILEWTAAPEEALHVAIYLNDRYELDGRDTNGYTGIAWSIGGVHDRAWNEREVFGKIRYMSYNGCKSKFNVKSYVERIKTL
ncbi:MAG: deoxyribodipyrimidine photo-lyase [Syntrophales bacterium]